MTIELHIDGKAIKLWNIPYTFGPVPIGESQMKMKELEFDKKILECKVDAGPLIYNQPYQMFALIRSRLKPESINGNEYAEFLIKVAKNKTNKVS